MRGGRRAVFAFALQGGDDVAAAIRSALGSLHIAREHADALETFSEYSVFISRRLQRTASCRLAGIGRAMIGHAGSL
jgi:hypothetical protein